MSKSNSEKVLDQKFDKYVEAFKDDHNFFQPFVDYFFRDEKGVLYPKSPARKAKFAEAMKQIRLDGPDGKQLWDDKIFVPTTIVHMDEYVFHISHLPDNTIYRIICNESVDKILLQHCKMENISEIKKIDLSPDPDYVKIMLAFVFEQYVDDPDRIYIPELWKNFSNEHTKECAEKYMDMKAAADDKEAEDAFDTI